MACVTKSPQSTAELDNVYELNRLSVEKWFRSGRFARIGTIGDGSCFFHSVCMALNPQSYRSATVENRKRMAHGLRCGFARRLTRDVYDDIVGVMKYDKTYETVKADLCKPSEWADELMIKLASTVLGVNIIFVDMSKDSVYCGVHSEKALEAAKRHQKPEVVTIVVAWVQHAHFEVIGRIDSVGPSDVKVRLAFDPSNVEDAITIQNLMETYKSRCPRA